MGLFDSGVGKTNNGAKPSAGIWAYAISQYAEFYDFKHVLVVGRVMTGLGGTLLLAKAGEVLWQEFSGLAERVRLHVPDERAVGLARPWRRPACPPLRGKNDETA